MTTLLLSDKLRMDEKHKDLGAELWWEALFNLPWFKLKLFLKDLLNEGSAPAMFCLKMLGWMALCKSWVPMSMLNMMIIQLCFLSQWNCDFSWKYRDHLQKNTCFTPLMVAGSGQCLHRGAVSSIRSVHNSIMKVLKWHNMLKVTTWTNLMNTWERLNQEFAKWVSI